MLHRALLIEDEVTARADLRQKLAVHPNVSLVGEAATVRRARELLAQPGYDLVFLDVQLVGGDAFNLVPDVRPDAQIIFSTAFDTFAVRAFEVNALDYLLKPIVPERLAQALRRVDARACLGADRRTPPTDATPRLALQLDDTVYLRDGLRARFVAVAEISGIEAQDNYSKVLLADGSHVLVRKSLKAWEDTLSPAAFMRVHRTQIVNLTRVRRYERDRDEHTWLFIDGAAQPVAASRERWSELRSRLESLRRAP